MDPAWVPVLVYVLPIALLIAAALARNVLDRAWIRAVGSAEGRPEESARLTARLLQLLLAQLLLRLAWFAGTVDKVCGPSTGKCLTGLDCACALGLTLLNRMSQFLGFIAVSTLLLQWLALTHPSGRTFSRVSLLLNLLHVWLLIVQLFVLGVSLFATLPAEQAQRLYDAYICLVAVLSSILSLIAAAAAMRVWRTFNADLAALRESREQLSKGHHREHLHTGSQHIHKVLSSALALTQLRASESTHTQHSHNMVLRIPVDADMNVAVVPPVQPAVAASPRKQRAGGGKSPRSPGADAAQPLLGRASYAASGDYDQDIAWPAGNEQDSDSSSSTRSSSVTGEPMQATPTPPAAPMQHTEHKDVDANLSPAAQASVDLLSRLIVLVRRSRLTIAVTSVACVVTYAIRAVLFLWRPVSNTNITGTAGAVLYPYFFYQVPEILPALLIAAQVSGASLDWLCSGTARKQRSSARSSGGGSASQLLLSSITGRTELSADMSHRDLMGNYAQARQWLLQRGVLARTTGQQDADVGAEPLS